MKYLWLSIAILSEVIATSSLKASNGFTRLLPSIAVVAGYASAFFFLSRTLKFIPVGIAYAIWSGVGTIAIGIVGTYFYKQTLDRAAILGMALIVAGVIVLNVFSKSTAH
ncbi:DMT family transporter [Terriglobus saanensis]|uniref:Small multidrug resistance protein n=1 Tax=Terriglobus saanensis (strain ATCC BAA-1853 / DSM 23119 / SP1PR4) TaxID=401053 RepID=E8UY62_TERSS|nr:multidrug efflux SMR transporter [Terriglobus saanensis]ADV80872.1 small multidrug resistance protein [Terriglobus saanensis SP1PR4]